MKTLQQEFAETAAAFGWTPAEQTAILLSYVADLGNSDSFYSFLSVLADELAGPETAEPAGDTDNIAVFFDRNLARRALARLTEVPASHTGPDMSLTVPEALWQQAVGLLAQQPTAAAPGTILCGWYGHFKDGATAAFAITAGEGRAYLDIWLILPDDKFPNWPNPSLQAQTTIETKHVFRHPDGTMRAVMLYHQ
jgi:hypothetical protein